MTSMTGFAYNPDTAVLPTCSMGLYMRADGGFDARTFECKEGGPPGIVRDDEYRLHHKATVPPLGCLASILPTLRLLTTPRTITPKFRGGSRAEGADEGH
jgi:hypothetical protein